MIRDISFWVKNTDDFYEKTKKFIENVDFYNRRVLFSGGVTGLVSSKNVALRGDWDKVLELVEDCGLEIEVLRAFLSVDFSPETALLSVLWFFSEAGVYPAGFDVSVYGNELAEFSVSIANLVCKDVESCTFIKFVKITGGFEIVSRDVDEFRYVVEKFSEVVSRFEEKDEEEE